MTRSIILAVDGSEPAQEAVNYVKNAFEPGNYNIVVTTVIPETPAYLDDHADVDTETLQGQFNRASDGYTQEVVDELTDVNFSASQTILEGHPGEEICQLSEDKNADSIVMGRRGLGAVEELLLGSVSQFVIHHAPCTVCLVPGPEEPEV